MARLKVTPDSVSVVKKTLTLGAPTGIVATPDSTAVFQSLMNKYGSDFKDLLNQKVSELKKFGVKEEDAFAGAMEDPKVKIALMKINQAGSNKDRQENKGKPGFDKNGYPLPKISEKQKSAVAAKLTGK